MALLRNTWTASDWPMEPVGLPTWLEHFAQKSLDHEVDSTVMQVSQADQG
jgi:hypothetical protein